MHEYMHQRTHTEMFPEALLLVAKVETTQLSRTVKLK